MPSDSIPRLLILRCDAVVDTSSTVITDFLTHFDPDCIYVIEDRLDMRVVSVIERCASCPVIYTRRSAIHTETFNNTTVTFVSSLDFVGGASTASGESIPDDVDYVVCDEIQTREDSVSMAVELEGFDHLARLQHRTAQDVTFLSGSMEASYNYVWQADVDGESVRLPVRGLGPIRRHGAPELACVSLDADGRIAVDSTPADKFGLRALTGVGEGTAEKLTQRGYESRDDLAEATKRELREIRGIGTSKAQSIQKSARALAESCIIRVTDDPVPAAEYSPLFVDIETDGFTPSVIWLIGVYDPKKDEYVDFIDTEPSLEAPGDATRDFVSWLASEYERPSLVAWNGHDFDFKHLNRFIRGYASEYAEYWSESVFEYDPYDWAVRKENAILPGRTNRIEDVADALGHGRDDDGAVFDGGSLARTIQRILVAPEHAHSVDWDAARAYCEADVRELAAVYDAIANAPPNHEHATDPADGTTTQSGLMDF